MDHCNRLQLSSISQGLRINGSTAPLLAYLFTSVKKCWLASIHLVQTQITDHELISKITFFSDITPFVPHKHLLKGSCLGGVLCT